ncbi:MAG: amino acid adenylation domain-containing protein [Crocosphaera sp.]
MVNTVKNIETANYQHQIDNLTNINVKYAPLSFAQKRIWFLEQLEPNSTAYNMLQPFQLEGNVDVKALEYSINEIIARHDSLRTGFVLEKEKPVQIVLPELSVTLPLVDLSHLSSREQQINIKEIISKTVEEKFDLEKAPLLRVTLLRLSAQVYQLLVTTHHIIADGWSYDVFIKDLEQFYTASITNNTPELSKLPLQYPDYAKSQKNNFTEDILKSKLAYWEKHLQGNLPILQLPLDHPKQPERTVPSGREEFNLDVSLTEKLKALSRQEGVTLYMTLLAAVNTLLYRYSHQEDIIIGTPIAGRNEKGTRDLIGCFINTLALRTDLSGNPTFQELLKRVRQVSLGAYRHLDTPFEKLVETLQPERELSIPPIFQVLFSFQNTPTPQLSLPELTIIPLDIQRGTAMLDLMVEIKETSSGLTIWFNYDKELFEPDTIKRMSGNFEVLLKGIIDNPGENIAYLPLLTEGEQHKLLVEWNQTQQNYPQDKCIHQLFEEQVEKTPDAVAVVFEGQELTYRELNEKANQLGHYLQKLGVKTETLVGICVERSSEMIIGLLGILKAGGAYVSIDPYYPTERIAYMLEDANIAVLLTQEKLLEELPANQAQVICLDNNWTEISLESEEQAESAVSHHNLAYVIYTSGSTGKPKGVMLEHQGVCNLSQAQIEILRVHPWSRVLQFASFSFDASTSEIVMALCSGARLCLVSKDALLPGENLQQVIRDYGITHLTLPPSALTVMSPEAFDELETVLVAGEACPSEIAAKWSKGRRFLNGYGPTEDTVCATIGEYQAEIEKFPIGKPLPNQQVYLLDSVLKPVPIGVPGELYIGGVGLARGYLNRPDLTAEKFISNPFDPTGQTRLYKTGDLCVYLPDGNIEYLGRIDHQVKIRGFRIELGEIESSIAQYPDVREAVVVAQGDNLGEKRLVAYIVPNSKPTNLIDDLRRSLSNNLPEYMIPGTFIVLEAFPLTPNGKIDRRSLPIPDWTQNQSSETFVPPSNDIEGQLVGIWEQVLGVQPIGIKDNFFALGGHSLISVRLFSQIERTFSVKLPLSTLFKAPTIQQLAQEIQEVTKGKIWESLVMIKPGNPHTPAVFIVHDGDGKTILYHTLAHHLESDRRVYGLRPNGKVGYPLLQTTIKVIASHYIEQIRTVQAEGPYLIGGFCLGGNIAFEMAGQLQSQGEEVALLFLLDSLEIQARGVEQAANKARSQRISQLFTQNEDKGKLQRLTSIGAQLSQKLKNFLVYKYQESFKQVKNRIRIPLYRYYLDKNKDLPPFLQNISIRELLEFDITKNYLPPHYQGQVVLVRSTEVIITDHPTINDTPVRYLCKDPEYLGWQRWSTDKITVYDVPGGHSSMLQDPYAQFLAENLQNSINQALN